MRIMVDFKGGPLDGSLSLEREPKPSEQMSYGEFVIALIGVTSNYQYNVGHIFQAPSPGWLVRTVVRKKTDAANFDQFIYQITDRVDGEDELLLVARLLSQWPPNTGSVLHFE